MSIHSLCADILIQMENVKVEVYSMFWYYFAEYDRRRLEERIRKVKDLLPLAEQIMRLKIGIGELFPQCMRKRI
jgi:hypothetical protein